jgi:hypothetical protein
MQEFGPREVLVWQADAADCIYVIKSGQVRWEPGGRSCLLVEGQSMADWAFPHGSRYRFPAQPCLLVEGQSMADWAFPHGSRYRFPAQPRLLVEGQSMADWAHGSRYRFPAQP